MFEISDGIVSSADTSIHKTIRDLIDSMACTRPESPFLVSAETGCVVTFRALQAQARNLASILQGLGLNRGDKVAFLMDNGVFTAQLFLGVMYGGFVAVPLNVIAGISQLSYTLEHSDAKVIYVGKEHEALLCELMEAVKRNIQVMPAESDASNIDSQVPNDDAKLPLVPKPEDAALLIYTSGSTGQPKAAVHTHRTVLAHGRNSISSHELTSTDRSLLVLPLYHINAECVTLVPTLMSGGSVVIPRRFNVSQFWDRLEEFQCTWSAVVPTIISQLLDWRDPRSDSRAGTFKRIRFLRSSSAPLAPSLHREFLEKFDVLLIQAMGSSEGGNIFSNPLPPGENKIGSPGIPWGFEAKIVDRHGVEVPPGESGEVLLRGAALAQGYYKDPEATGAVFDPEGWFHTGDLAYRDSDGYFFIVGRSKELIIKGGVNIAPRQIDDVLESHPAVLEAAAVGVPDNYLGEDLVAFVVLRSGVACDEKELLSFCESRLGLFKTPTRIHFADDLPKGPSGKVQRLRLTDTPSSFANELSVPSGTEFGAAHGNGHVHATSSIERIEQVIAEVWGQVLSQLHVDSDRNFFALGGHSLLAVQCLSLLREQIPTPLSLSDFFENATIAQQAALVRRRLNQDRATKGGSGTGRPAQNTEDKLQNVSSSVSPAVILPRDRTLPCPLTPAQQRLWFLEQVNPGLLAYNEAEAVRLIGELNVDAMDRALQVIIDRHEVLRSTIQLMANEPVAVVHESWPFEMKKIDLSAFSGSEQEKELERLLVEEPRRPYRLDVEPGLRATLLRLGAQEHVLTLMMHHIICDWASMGVFWRELSAVYRSFCRGELPSLPSLAIQQGDYAAWQVQHNQQTNFAEDLTYWEDNLCGAPHLLELPADRTRPATFSYRGAKQRFILNSKVTQALRKLGQQAQTTFFTIFAAALSVLFYRYTGREDILLGIPIADRDRKETQSMIGFLLHTQVLRTTLSADMTFRELLARVQKAALDLYLHRAAPFEQVVHRIQPERSLSYSPLFQAMLNWRDRDQMLSFIGLEGLSVETLLAHSKTSKFDLTLFATDCGDEIWLEAEYSTDLFDDTRISRMLNHYQDLLDAVAADPDQPLCKPPLLTDVEVQQIVTEWNATERAYPRETSLAALVERQVNRTPDAVAAVFEGSSITYRGLNEWANQLAHELRKNGAGPDRLVGVCLERSLGMMAALVAVVKAGAAYVPLDPDMPTARLGYMIEDSGMQFLLTQKGLQSSLIAFAGTMIDVDGGEWKSNSRENPDVPVTPEDLAYVIYTSGSTGKPKGVQIGRGSLTNLLWSMKEWLKPEAGQATLAATTISFDIAGLEIWLPLLVGGHVVVVSRETAINGQELAEVIKDQDVRLIQATPTTWRLLLDSGWSGKSDVVAICTGEAMPREVGAQLRPLVGSLWNFYGPTETTIWSTGFFVEKGDEPVLIGRPIANTQCYILDEQRQPVPVGVVGELYIGGDGLARGYLNRPPLTEEKFVPNPFNPGKRMFRTGDMARYRADGNIECLGRTDHQVKVRGYRIELGEVESVLNSQPGVRQSVVVVREDHPGDKQLVAYFVATETAVPDRGELRALLKQRLPDYMVPTDYVVLDSIPTTPNGKVDRLALPALKTTDRVRDARCVPPRDEFEQLVCDAWAEVLGLERVGVHDNFFELGGHSLLAMRLILRLQEIIPGEPLPLRALLEAPTVEELAVWLRTRKAGKGQFMVRMRPGTSERPPFFCVHGAGGNVLDLRALAMAMPPELPFYCLEDKGLDGSAPFETVEEAARCYIDEIRRLQPHGPYYLSGWCYGGIVAFEMARRLEELAEPVAALVLIDSFNPAFVKSLSKRQLLWRNVRYYMRRTLWHAQRTFALPPGKWLGYIGRPLKHFCVGVWDPAKVLVIYDEERVSSIASTPNGESLKRMMSASLRARREFVPKSYNGRALIFRARGRNLYQYDDHHLGWGSALRGSVECFEIEAAHETILDPPAVHLVAEKLDAKLKELAVETKKVSSFQSNQSRLESGLATV
ncbi:MAG TPA: amino acid adenylation domain-containing protein [Candidatus Sulfotelmatobacter sp.]|nr:amino acid adenylation domain-containing protein [Candidatus Sulfotelmatobacter sp.]